mgnify:CR=1 FL=1
MVSQRKQLSVHSGQWGKKRLKYWQAVSQQISWMKCRWNTKWRAKTGAEKKKRERERETRGEQTERKRKREREEGETKVKSFRLIELEVTDREWLPRLPLLILCNYFTIHSAAWHSLPIEQSLKSSYPSKLPRRRATSFFSLSLSFFSLLSSLFFR